MWQQELSCAYIRTLTYVYTHTAVLSRYPLHPPALPQSVSWLAGSIPPNFLWLVGFLLSKTGSSCMYRIQKSFPSPLYIGPQNYYLLLLCNSLKWELLVWSLRFVKFPNKEKLFRCSQSPLKWLGQVSICISKNVYTLGSRVRVQQSPPPSPKSLKVLCSPHF